MAFQLGGLYDWTNGREEVSRLEEKSGEDVVSHRLVSTYTANILPRVGGECVAHIATHYERDGTGIESRCSRDFPRQSRPAYPASYTMCTGSIPG